MNVETLLYVYIGICVSLILFNCIYVFFIRRSEKRLSKRTFYYDLKITEQLDLIKDGKHVTEPHKKLLCKKLKKTANLTAYDKSLDSFYQKQPDETKAYLAEIYSVFVYLCEKYQGHDTIKAAYFPYIISKYDILLADGSTEIIDAMFELLYSSDVYCRENALKAIYATGECENVVRALKLIDENESFHHPKLVCDGLMGFSGDRSKLGNMLLSDFDAFSIDMQVNILNFIRFAGVRCDQMMLEILTDEERNQELRFSAIRYFEKFVTEAARAPLQAMAKNEEDRIWEYPAIASSALKSYPDEVTFEILTENLSHHNWYVRQNSAISCEKLGLSYTDLVEIFDGEDRYAREMIKYRLDRREAEQEVVRA